MKSGFVKSALLIIIFFFQLDFVTGQTKKKIEILGANQLKLIEVGNQPARTLSGNVRMRQNDIHLNCDSALFYTNINSIDAFGRVHIHDTSGTNIYADSLKYNGDTKIAVLYGNVKVVDVQMNLETQRLTYHTETKNAYYTSGGKITNDDILLTSGKGYYYSTGDTYFRDSVVLLGKTYDVYADTLRYNINTEVTYFHGPTDIISKKQNIYCESGWYDAQTGISVFGQNTVLTDGSQRLFADSLYYDDNLSLGRAYKNFKWIDTSMSVILSGERAFYFQDNQNITAYDEALLTYLIDGDSLFLTADTLKSNNDTVNDVTEFYAFYDVRIYKPNLQGRCDSLFFSFKDSMIRMYNEPVLWNEENQLTGDTIVLTLRNDKIDQVELYKNGFIINEAGTGLFNQIKGKHIYGYFKDSQLDKMLIEGNGESIYYATDDEEAFIGLNEAVCSKMWIYLKDEAVNRIVFIDKPEATFHPIQQINPGNFILKDFRWRESERPLSKADLFLRNQTEVE